MTFLPHSKETAEPRRAHGLNRLLTILVLILAFLAASFPARNSDLWFHLATGRLLTQGQFSFGTDPFAYTTQHVYWACHSWLFDWALYGLHGLIGGAGLVVLKAFVVAVLAGLLLRIHRRGGAAGLPAVCTTLAILAISPRLLLQPVCISYFFLGLTLWLLWQRAGSVSDGTTGETPVPLSAVANASGSFAGVWSLLLVFVLWVNVDEWFLLGPLLTALFWLDGRLQPARSASDGQRRIPSWIVPAGFAVCLLNPYTYHAFTLPAEFSVVSWNSGLREDARFRTLFACPWYADYLQAALRLNAAVLSYYALASLGLASFVLHRPALSDWRFFVWFPFALLAAWQVRLIPFFAVVAAPITALNWQDIVRARLASPYTRGRFVLGASYSVLLLSLLSLIVLTWLGWLAGYDREERHVAWGIQEEPSLHQAAATLEEWRRQDLLAESERIFNLAPESAHYGAWFCPGERHFFDHRYPLFAEAVRDYEVACRALLSPMKGPEQKLSADWRWVFHANKIGIVVFYDRDPQRLFGFLQRLAGDPQHWTLLRVAGQVVLAGWNEARAPGAFAPLAFDAERLTFGPPDVKAQYEAPPAPQQGPQQLPSRPGFWARLARPSSPPSWESSAATMYLHYFHDSEAIQRQDRLQALWSTYAAGLAALPAQAPAITQAAFQLLSSRELLSHNDAAPQFLVREQLGPYFAPLMDRSPALPLLAIRAARRAVAANPADANAWLRLGQAYLLLRDFTCEHSINPEQLPPLTQLRHVQIAAALEQAARLDPNLEAAHHELAFLYGPAKALDLALEHRQAEARLSRQSGSRPGESADEFAYRIKTLDKDTANMEGLVQHNREQYASVSKSLQGDRLALTRLALRLGLARQAVEEALLPAPVELLRGEGIRLELELLLSLGRVQEVRDILNEKEARANKQVLGNSEYDWPAYEWLHVLAAAAVGDYAQCRENLGAIRAVKRAAHDRMRQQARAFERDLPPLALNLLSGSPPFVPAFTALFLGSALERRTMRERTLRAHQADLCVLEGMLALEQGDSKAARSAFAEAEKIAAAISFASRPILAGYFGKLKAYQPAKSEKE